jgi:signal transduction histidine kinase
MFLYIYIHTHSEDQLQLAEQIASSSATLLGLVNDILDLAKIEKGMMDLVSVQFELRCVCMLVCIYVCMISWPRSKRE